jgi:dihydroflavonol-4-reductase
MRIAITGATGFLGRHLVERLAPNHDLVCISRSGNAPEGCESKKIDVVKGRGLKAAFAKADVVVHAAGLVSHGLERADETWAVHVTGTQNVIEAAKGARVSRLVHLSTSGTVAVSADKDFVGTEDSDPPEAIISRWPYYRSKLYAEQLALQCDGMDVICLNPSLLLGPGDDAGGASTHAVSVFLDHGVPFAPPGTVSFVDVRDAASAVESALTRGRAGERYLLASGNLSFEEFYARLARMSGRSEPILAMPQLTRRALDWFPRWGKDRGISAGVGPVISREDLELASHHWTVDSAKASAELNWTPRGPNETLEDTVMDLVGRKKSRFGDFS